MGGSTCECSEIVRAHKHNLTIISTYPVNSLVLVKSNRIIDSIDNITMMIHVDDNDSNNNNSTELKELLMEFQSLFGALEIEEDTTTIDILDEDLILTSGITDSLRLAHQSKQEKENKTMPKKHSRDDECNKEQGSSKRVCCQGRNRSGMRRGYGLNQNRRHLVVKKIHYQITAEDDPVL